MSSAPGVQPVVPCGWSFIAASIAASSVPLRIVLSEAMALMAFDPRETHTHETFESCDLSGWGFGGGPGSVGARFRTGMARGAGGLGMGRGLGRVGSSPPAWGMRGGEGASKVGGFHGCHIGCNLPRSSLCGGWLILHEEGLESCCKG